jgi:dTDP-4-dehydrorhamnose reductase
MRVAVLGASGLLGKYLLREWRSDEVIGFSSRDLDIRDEAQVRNAMAMQRPDWIVLAAAYTDVDGCESDQELAFQTNTVGAANVAKAAQEQGSRLLFVSSDYVFDGMKTSPYETDDPRNPKSVYGRSKAEAEIGIAKVLPDACIVRTSWVFGLGGKCFPDTILKLAATRTEIEVVNDQRGCPTYALDLARAICHLCSNDSAGMVHVTNAGDCTWFEFASEIVRQAALPTIVHPTTTDKFPRPAPRPKYSVLSANSLLKYKLQMPPWQEALKNYLVERNLRN